MRKTCVAMSACILLLAASLLGCGDQKVIGGIKYDTYGLMNADAKKNETIEYEVIWGNVVWGCVLCETLVAPVYFFGFSLFEPVGPKGAVKGAVNH